MEHKATQMQQNREGIARTTLLVILASETVFFGTLLVAYLYLRVGQANWPYSHASFARLLLPVFNTGVLLLSALIAHRAVLSIQQGNVPALKSNLTVTLLLGLLFVVGQITEFTHSGMQPNDLAFGGVFFTLIGFHALHVLAGMVVLALNLLRARLGDFSRGFHVPVKAGAWFWYYVTAVWLALFTALYLI